MSKIPVTVIVPVKNEEKNIAECLGGLTQYSEVILLDSESTDNTVEIAKAFKNVKVRKFKWNGEYPKKKQWALNNLKTKNDWILFVDGDEVFSNTLNKEIAFSIDGEENAFYISADVWFMGKELKHGRKLSKIILTNKYYVHFPVVDDLHALQMGELEGHYQPIVKGRVGKLKSKFKHNDQRGLYSLFYKHNIYSSWQAEIKRGIYGWGWRGIVKRIFHNIPFKPTIAFLDSYVFKLGFLDGYYGYHYAKFRSMYYWQTNLKKKENKLCRNLAKNKNINDKK